MRVYNFSPGPSILPEIVLQQISESLFSYNGTGMSTMEMSHRQKDFIEIADETKLLLKELMSIPNNYHVLFMQGGASLQFAMAPLNLYRNGVADYIMTGMFAERAAQQARKYLKVNEIVSSKDKDHTYIPKITEDLMTPNADYLHFTKNNTIYGTTIKEVPPTKAPVVCDMTSAILSEPCDVSKYGIIYAGAQKNLGIAGVTIVIIREDLIGNAMPITPEMLDYSTYYNNDSLYNTPSTFSVFVTMLMLRWYKQQGGVNAIEQINKAKAKTLYDSIDNSLLFKPRALKEDRSIMNVTFSTGNDELDNKFIKEAHENGLSNLGGYRATGGMRASIYNAMPLDGVNKLVSFMKDFEANNV